MFFAMAQFLAAVIGKLLLPVLEIYFCFAACACVWGSRAVEEAAALFSKCLHWLLKVCGAVFSFVLGLQSMLAGTADSAALAHRQKCLARRSAGGGGCRRCGPDRRGRRRGSCSKARWP